MIALYEAAEHHNAPQLMEICLRTMVYEYPHVSKQPEFSMLSKKVQEKILELRNKYENEVKTNKEKHEQRSKLLTVLYPQ